MFNQDTRVLVAEDDHVAMYICHLLLKRLGFVRIDAAKDGDEAWALLQACDADPYRLLISDNQMPGMTGPKILERMRHSGKPVLEHMPFLLLSNFKPQNDAWKLGPGLTDFMQKFPSETVLKAKIEQMILK